jgi:DNA-binding transcriptional LysR family regulator
VALSHVIEEKLIANELDMAFAACEMSSSRFVSTPVELVDFVWVCSPDRRDVPDVLTPKNLGELPIIATSREWQFRGSTLAWLTANDVHFRDLTIFGPPHPLHRPVLVSHMCQSGFTSRTSRLAACGC